MSNLSQPASTKFHKGDLVYYLSRLIIPDGVKNKNSLLHNLLFEHKRADYKHLNEIGIILDVLKAGNYIGYIWYCQNTMDYNLVFEEEIDDKGLK